MADRQRKSAPGKPGTAPRWTSGAKDGVGTAYTSGGGHSLVWFAFAQGVVREIYFPRPDVPCTRSLGLIVTDRHEFYSDERRDAVHRHEFLEPGVPGYRLTNECRAGRYRIEKTVFAHPRHHAVVQKTSFQALNGDLNDFGLFVILEPHLGGGGAKNSAWIDDYKGTTMLFARQTRYALALACSTGWAQASVGYVGKSDGRGQLRRRRRLTKLYQEAFSGNVALTGEVDPASCGGEFLLAVGFGADPQEAAYHARSVQCDDSASAQEIYLQGWRAFQQTIGPLASLSPEDEKLYRASAAVMSVHEGKTTDGMVAGLAVPWGMVTSDDDRLKEGYHLVWPRDMVESAGGLLAAGARDDVIRRLQFLQVTQEPDGHWPQNMWLDGAPFWTAIQLCETALPILLVDLLRHRDGARFSAERYWPMVRAAAGYLVRRGPATEEDRWERRPGYTPYTVATVIAALCCAAELADVLQERSVAHYLRETADSWNACVEGWLYVTDTELARRLEVPGYYARVLTKQTVAPAAPAQEAVRLQGTPERINGISATEMVSPDALALVRFGLRRADDPRIVDTVKVIDALLRVETSRGPSWRRFNGDDYGETPEGKPFHGHARGGIGRPWPLLTGERAHFELAAGRPTEAWRLMEAMRAFAGEGDMLPEQVWDADDIIERRLRNGGPTGSACPLVWAHAEYVKLCRSLHDARIFDMPEASRKRYLPETSPAAHAVWRKDHSIRNLRVGSGLRIECERPGSVRWSCDDWNTAAETAMRDSNLGIYFADLLGDSGKRGAAKRLRFVINEPDRKSDEFVIVFDDAADRAVSES